ncbi:Heat stress transcription factor A-3 [Acorus calamus]|uniref:Heat stress transcription factor A-3 n=1 Tax=Acorus calamus TaxID=4465 RepID=A0AAV9FFH2_ACOCL|nr:Heat stress transcription factor A-3 [Acorus calamus]
MDPSQDLAILDVLSDEPVPIELPKSSHGESSDLYVGGDSSPRPLEVLKGIPIPPFLSKLYDIVGDSSVDRVVSWGQSGESFVVWDPIEFSKAVLPRHFKHGNFSSFVRQLNTYVGISLNQPGLPVELFVALFIACDGCGDDSSILLVISFFYHFTLRVQGFRKIDADRWEFANEDFLRGKKNLLKNIHRRRSSQIQPMTTNVSLPTNSGGKLRLEGEIEDLRREKTFLIEELIKLNKEHLESVQLVDSLNRRMQSAEQRQKQTVIFMAKLLQNTAFLSHLRQQKGQWEIAPPQPKRRFSKHKRVDQGDSIASLEGQIVKYDVETSDSSTSLVLSEVESDMSELELGLGLELAVQTQTEDIKAGPMFLGSEDALFTGKDVGASSNAENFVHFPDGLSSEKNVPDMMGFVAGEDYSSPIYDDNVWGNISQELDIASGSSALWDFGSPSAEEILKIDEWVGDGLQSKAESLADINASSEEP